MILQNGILQSELLMDLPVIHGFTTRQRGNLGFGKNPGDHEVVENRKRLFNDLELTSRTLVQPRQIHSSRAISEAEFVDGCEADASYGSSSGSLHSILTADCVPLLLYHDDGLVAAIHAGWRGLIGGIVPETLRRLPAHPRVAIGPAIGVCCYVVSQDLAGKFENKFGKNVVQSSATGPHLDLVRTALIQLENAGIEEFDAAHLCTSCHADLFYSYRRDGSTGRQMSFIGMR